MTDWEHSPVHRLFDAGAYMVTTGAYEKAPFWDTPQKLTFVRDTLFELCEDYCRRLQAWAILNNHYHFLALCPGDPAKLRDIMRKFHSITARVINKMDAVSGREIWFRYWDSHITFERSYYARLNYVHQNPVHHGGVPLADQYEWCSAKWFKMNAEAPLRKSVLGFKTNEVSIEDNF